MGGRSWSWSILEEKTGKRKDEREETRQRLFPFPCLLSLVSCPASGRVLLCLSVLSRRSLYRDSKKQNKNVLGPVVVLGCPSHTRKNKTKTFCNVSSRLGIVLGGVVLPAQENWRQHKGVGVTWLRLSLFFLRFVLSCVCLSICLYLAVLSCMACLPALPCLVMPHCLVYSLSWCTFLILFCHCLGFWIFLSC